MSHRLGLLVIAIGLILGSLSSQAQENLSPALESKPVPGIGQQTSAPKTDDGAGRQGQNASALLAIIDRVEATVRELVPKQDQKAEERKEKREIDDLEAQKEMAQWAKFMFWATFGTVILTGVGVFLIYKTLGYTRDAASAAKAAVTEAEKATAAAMDTVAITRQIGEAQIRPYVGFLPARWISHREADGTQRVFWRFRWGLKNTGATPTRNLLVRQFAQVAPVGSIPQGIPDWVTATPASIPAGADIGLENLDVWGDELEEVQRGLKTICIFIEAIYGNSINPDSRHITRIGLRSTVVTASPRDYWHAETNPLDVRFVHINGLNCADGDCS